MGIGSMLDEPVPSGCSQDCADVEATEELEEYLEWPRNEKVGVGGVEPSDVVHEEEHEGVNCEYVVATAASPKLLSEDFAATSFGNWSCRNSRMVCFVK